MPGEQLALIAARYALAGAVVTILVDSALAMRKAHATTA